MISNNDNNLWYLIFMFFLVTEKNNDMINLLYSNTFEEDFNKLINQLKEINAKQFKDNCIQNLKNNQNIIFNLNKAYNKIKIGENK